MNYKKWGKTRKMGKARYVWFYSVFLGSIFITCFLLAYNYFIKNDQFDLESYFIFFILNSILSFFTARFTWKRSEDKYLIHLEKQDNSTE